MPVQTRYMTKMTNVSVKNTEAPKKMSVKKTNITKASTQNTKLPEKNIAKENITVENHIIPTQQKSSANLFVYKDKKTGIEYLTEEQIQMRGITNELYTLDNEYIVGWLLYETITEIDPDYLKTVPKKVADRKDLFALAPEGYLWEEDENTSWYFDEWQILRKHEYKRGTKFNIYLATSKEILEDSEEEEEEEE